MSESDSQEFTLDFFERLRERALQQQEIEEIRRLWSEGLHSGASRFAEMDEIKAEARRRFEAQSKQDVLCP